MTVTLRSNQVTHWLNGQQAHTTSDLYSSLRRLLLLEGGRKEKDRSLAPTCVPSLPSHAVRRLRTLPVFEDTDGVLLAGVSMLGVLRVCVHSLGAQWQP